jgi:Co/Zn/Cd efflux system component
VILARHRRGGVHMRASYIFTSSDVIANLGVMLSGALVMASGSRLPDLLVGALIALVVIRGGVRILREAGRARAAQSGREP